MIGQHAPLRRLSKQAFSIARKKRKQPGWWRSWKYLVETFSIDASLGGCTLPVVEETTAVVSVTFVRGCVLSLYGVLYGDLVGRRPLLWSEYTAQVACMHHSQRMSCNSLPSSSGIPSMAHTIVRVAAAVIVRVTLLPTFFLPPVSLKGL